MTRGWSGAGAGPGLGRRAQRDGVERAAKGRGREAARRRRGVGRESEPDTADWEDPHSNGAPRKQNLAEGFLARATGPGTTSEPL